MNAICSMRVQVNQSECCRCNALCSTCVGGLYGVWLNSSYLHPYMCSRNVTAYYACEEATQKTMCFTPLGDCSLVQILCTYIRTYIIETLNTSTCTSNFIFIAIILDCWHCKLKNASTSCRVRYVCTYSSCYRLRGNGYLGHVLPHAHAE